jgi:hypothetical protein
MAGGSEVKWVVVDTSYLAELYRLPGMFEEVAHAAIVEKFRTHIEKSGRIYVPVSVIFEVANHIADISDGAVRRDLAIRLRGAVETSLETQAPWIIVPTVSREILWDLTEALLGLCVTFADEYAVQGIGLTDASIIDYAKTLMGTRGNRIPRPPIHIWTRDAALKAREPDSEDQAFV